MNTSTTTLICRKLLGLVVLLGLMRMGARANETKRPPNIVFFFVDDFGRQDLSCYGSKLYETPNMDQLAAQGVRFTNAYTAYPRCVPSRTAVMSGKYPARLSKAKTKSKHSLPLEEVTFAEALKAKGYTTCYIGKWHVGHEGGWPSDQGFDKAVCTGSAGAPESYFYPFIPTRKIEGAVKSKKGDYLTDKLTDEAVSFISKSKDKPFLLVVAHYAVHTPIQAPEDLIKKYQEKIKKLKIPQGGEKSDADVVQDRRARVKTVQNNPTYAGMVEKVDTSLGRIMKTLDELKIADNTVIILFSDHGGLSARGTTSNRELATSNLPYRQGKGSIFDGGIRVPMIVRWPGVAKPGIVSDVQVTGVDHYPTMLEMAGLPLLPKQHVDGRSYVRALKGNHYQREAMFFYKSNARPDSTGDDRGMALIEGQYKVIEWFDGGLIELFDLKNDVGEKNNLAGKMPEKVRELLAKMRTMEESVGNSREAGKAAMLKRLARKKK